jgi:hypothetical protein
VPGVEAYFDESYGKVGRRRILCVAGYLFTDRAARRLTREWQAVLREYHLPYFHTSECMHLTKTFKNISRADSISIQRRMIELIKRRTIKGMAVTVDLDEYDKLMPKMDIIGTAYTFCAHVIVGGVIHWLETTDIPGDVSYFFEAGHVSQPQAERIMEMIFHEPELKSATRYNTHGFVEKAACPPVQAADLLAWHWYTDIRHQIEGTERRRDCASLLLHKHDTVHIGGKKIMELSNKWTGTRYMLDLRTLILGDRDEPER